MGLIGTLNVFALAVVPVATVIAGFELSWPRVAAMTAGGIAVGLVESIAVGALATWIARPQAVLMVSLISSLVVSLILRFVGQHYRRWLRQAGRGAAVGSAVGNVILSVLGPLYRAASSPGFEGALLANAGLSNLRFVQWLLMTAIVVPDGVSPNNVIDGGAAVGAVAAALACVAGLAVHLYGHEQHVAAISLEVAASFLASGVLAVAFVVSRRVTKRHAA